MKQSAKLDLLVRGGTLVIPGLGQVKVDVGIADGKIAVLGENLAQPAAETYDPTGERFDPETSDVLSVRAGGDGVDPGVVVETIDKGYRLDGQVLRGRALTGLVLVVASLILVTLEKMPETTQDWVDLGGTLTTFGLSMAAALVGAFTLAWYLPSIPYANRLILKPPTDEEDTPDAAGSLPAHAGLLGAMGVAATPLRPAGKAQFGEDFLDVVAEGDYVNVGSRVQVIEIEGNRIVVKEV